MLQLGNPLPLDGKDELLRKEVIQPHLPVRLPCYDFTLIADQQAAVNTFPGLVHTARQATKVGSTRSRCANRKEAAA